MRKLTLLCAVSLLPTTAAFAQVVTNTQALDALEGPSKPQDKKPAPAKAASPHAAPAPKRVLPPAQRQRPVQNSAPAAQPPATPAVKPTAPAATQQKITPPPAGNTPGSTSAAPEVSKPAPGHTPPSPTIPAAPPPPPILAPAAPDVELHPFPVPPQPVVDLKAKGEVTPLARGLRLTFAVGSADLNPTTHQAILTFGQSLADKPHARALIDAYSSTIADDPSLPRRMALSRGLAARSVLMNAGIPSTRIYLRVIGVPKEKAALEAGSQDHIDIYQSDETTP